MITALSSGYMVLHGKSYLNAANRAAEFLWENMWAENGCLLRIYKNGESKINGCLEDYSYFLEGLITLYEASFNILWIERAKHLADKMIDEFYDHNEGGFFITGHSSEALIVRLKNAADEAIPSANAIAIQSLIKLSHLTGIKAYLSIAEKSVHSFKQLIEKNPAAYAGILAGADFLSSSITEVIFSGSYTHHAFGDMRDALYQDYRPNKIVLWSENKNVLKQLPLAKGKTSVDSTPVIFLCQNGTCYPPVKTGKALIDLLESPPEIRLNIFNYEKQIENTQKEEQGKFLGVMDQIFKHSGLKK